MQLQDVLGALAFVFLIGLGCFSNYLTHYISVQVLTEDFEVRKWLENYEASSRSNNFSTRRFFIQNLLSLREALKIYKN